MNPFGFVVRKKKKVVRAPAPPRNVPPPRVQITITGPTGSVNFDQGQMPTIALVNQAEDNLGVSWDALVSALGRYVNEHIAPVWGTPANIVSATSIPAGAWAIVFKDVSDVPGALGYHDVTPEGLPMSYVFVRTAKNAGEKPSVTAAHEIAEMLIDPAINLACQAPNGDFWAYEVGDPVQEDEYTIDGVTVSNFVYPAFFEAFRAGRPNQKYDYLSLLTAPFSLRPGGYIPVYRNGSWTQVFGSVEKEERYLASGRGLRFRSRSR